MGTNYYIGKICKECKHFEEVFHIGKSSAGWCFSLHVNDEINSLAALLCRLQYLQENEDIYDEYENKISLPDLISIITERYRKDIDTAEPSPRPYGYKSWDDFHIKNNSEFGPNGLLRHKIDGEHCIGHGSGTWDLITGTFC